MAILGDVSIYSTYCYVVELLKAEGFPCMMVPGVPSFCAVAPAGQKPDGAGPALHILPAAAGLGEAWICGEQGADEGGQKPQAAAGGAGGPGAAGPGRPWWRTAACRRSGRLQISQKSLIPKGILQRL